MNHSGQVTVGPRCYIRVFTFYSLNCFTPFPPLLITLKPKASPCLFPIFQSEAAATALSTQPLRYSSHVPPSSGIINRRRYLGSRKTHVPLLPPSSRRDLRPFFQLYPEARRNKNRGNCEHEIDDDNIYA